MISAVRQLLPLNKFQFQLFTDILNVFDKKQLAHVKKGIKLNWFRLRTESMKSSLVQNNSYVQLQLLEKHQEEFVEDCNKELKRAWFEQQFIAFAPKAPVIIPQYVAPNIVGMEAIKRACALQLFATERIHILLLGDPGTGKTDIVRSTTQMHPISSFGLGSGTSGVGLSISVVGKEISPGLLPIANNGICGIDELNLMAEKDRASLYNAMEKGFVTYNKKNVSQRFDANVRVIATANPIGDHFVGRGIETFKKQLPFESALLSRFHLVFFIRRPNMERFVDITRKIVENVHIAPKEDDCLFIKEYVDYAQDIEVVFDKALESFVVEWSKKIKEHEERFVVNISPRTIIGVIRIAQASARMQLRTKVTTDDLKVAMDLMQTALEINI